MSQEISLESILAEIAAAPALSDLQEVRTRWVGKKGWVTDQMKGLAALEPAERRQRGALLNNWRQMVLQAINRRENVLADQEERKQLAQEALDLTVPGRRPVAGLLHPITRVRRRIEDVLLRMGFSLAFGPQVESEWYNFEALNIPSTHPARDMQDSFFVDIPGMVLRTHTSPVQIRSMQRHAGRLPVKILAPGAAYRRDDDATHVPMFQQVEGLMIDRHISLSDLKGVLTTMVRALLGDQVGTRFRPSYFPFTEPSVEMDVACALCQGSGCRVCKGSGWVEILGSGMVHPVVLKNGGYNPDQVSGFAFGMGIERIAMRFFGLDDLRLLYQNDLTYLKGFASGGGMDI